jgi:hypothetical protein
MNTAWIENGTLPGLISVPLSDSREIAAEIFNKIMRGVTI